MSADGMLFTRCRDCGALGHLPRPFCKSCGGDDLAHEPLSGGGVVSAVTVVHRAPSPELQALAPYAVCLVEADEGVRLMARADPGLEIGQRVTVAMTDFARARVPHASPAEQRDEPITAKMETR